ncbi:hypothetical protein M422DRAFT_70673 [Sphaerobolus stellatus SS14]|uniref:Peptidase C14 caspase domain-containing protein n=1 Tax=Sphaerobolus stellatus (strain SS14) TaxID=990650 RepID=A0A0C9UBS7_SPHS4|nr:hypothetical protein M422DRAFT_70673 [Sphaerobolus stellatus SS14]
MAPCLYQPEASPVRRALCVAIEYEKGDQILLPQIPGAHRDARNLAKVLKEKFKYEVTLLLDNGSGPEPNRNNIWAALKKMVSESKAGDRLFFHYSGHGGQVPNLDGSESDGFDEVLVPIGSSKRKAEWLKDTVLQDDDLNKLVTSLPTESSLVALFDCCHSGTALDLPYTRRFERRTFSSSSGTVTGLLDLCAEPESIANIPGLETVLPPVSILSGGNEILNKESHSRRASHNTSRKMSATVRVDLVTDNYTPPSDVRPVKKRKCRSHVLRGASKDPKGQKTENSSNKPSIFLWAACADDKEAYGGKKSGGLLTNVFLECLKENYVTEYTLGDLLDEAHHRLQAKAERIAKKAPDAIHQQLWFSSNTLPDYDSRMPF